MVAADTLAARPVRDAIAMSHAPSATAPLPYLTVADGPGWPGLAGVPTAPPDQAPDRLRAAAAAGDPVRVVLYRPSPAVRPADVGRAVGALWSADNRVQIVLALADTDDAWAAVGEHLRPGDAVVAVPASVTGPAVAQLAAVLAAKWSATADAAATAGDVDRQVASRTADLHRAALHDRLTGLGNRALLNDRLTQLLAAAAADPRRTFAVLFLDFDRFKVVNDSLGHDVGDGLLVAIADRLRKALRDTDTVSTGSVGDADLAGPAADAPATHTTAARLGGDEFILLLDRLRDPADATRVAARVLDSLAVPYRVRGHTIHSTASIGVTTSTIGYDSAAAMIRDADTAMYRAKATGKARAVLFDQDMHRQAVERLTLEGDLREALGRDQFGLLYQPIVNLTTGAVTGFEVLLRWHHPDRGTVSPSMFLPIAEEIGVMGALGDWVIDAACRQLAEWQQRHVRSFNKLSVNLNVSRRQLTGSGFVARLGAALTAHALPPSALHLEFTERAVAHDPVAAATILARLRGMGVELHLDNFGTGQSSLSCLHRYPLTGVKVDAGFTRDALTRPAHRTILAAVVDLARDLNLQLTAEGMESADQVALLRQLGCDRGQGYHFGQPLDAAAAEALVLAGGPEGSGRGFQ